jgi:hypothetical protein
VVQQRLKQKLKAIDGVTDVHDLHIWMLSVDRPVVTVHIKASDTQQVSEPTTAHRIDRLDSCMRTWNASKWYRRGRLVSLTCSPACSIPPPP